MAEFLAIPYDLKMPRYYEGRTNQKEHASANRSWLPPTPGLRDWRTQMDCEEIERFEAAAGDLLHHLGYELTFARIGPTTRRQVERVRDTFTAEAHERRWRLPDRW